MEAQFCANEECIKHKEHRGGKFLYAVGEGKTYCEECYAMRHVFNSGRNLWDFTTTHFDGTPVHVKNLSHLRQLEKHYGVSNQLANFMEKNCH